MNMIHNVNNILIIILIMLIMFCICSYIFSYNYKQNNNIHSKYSKRNDNNNTLYYKNIYLDRHLDSHLDNQIDNNIQLLELLNLAQANALEIIKSNKLDDPIVYKVYKEDNAHKEHKEHKEHNANSKEPFYNVLDNRLISQNQTSKYILDLQSLQYWLNNKYNGTNGILNKLNKDLPKAVSITNMNKQILLDFLTYVYFDNYINMNNKMNAESYKVFLKYKEPNNNKYYKQYTQ